MELKSNTGVVREIGRSIPYKQLNEFIDILRQIQEQDMDVLVPITGFKGAGKSTLGIQIIRRYIKRYLKRPFSVNKFIAYDNYDVMKKIKELPPYSPLLCDEAVRFAMAEDWMKSESKEMKKTFAQIRTKHLLIIFCIPEFWWIDRKYREDMTLFWIHIFRRGYGLIFTPDMRIGIDDKWHRKEFKKKITRSINIFSDIKNVLSSYRKHPCYWSDLAFPKCPQELYDSYIKIRNERALSPSPTITKVDLIKILMWRLKQDKELKLTYQDLSNMLRDPITHKLPFRNMRTTSDTIGSWVADIRGKIKSYKLSRYT